MTSSLTTMGAAATMSSREIAELTGKEHKNVLRDIRVMLIELHGAEHLARIVPEQYRNRHSEFVRENADTILAAICGDGSELSHQDQRGFAWERDARGYVSGFSLDKTHTMTLISGYNVKLRHRIVTRWQELEAQAARPMSQLEILVANAQALLEIDRQQRAILQAQERVTAEVVRIESRVDEVAQLAASSHVWDHCPQNCESISKIRGRMLKQYSLPCWVVDMVMRELPLSPKVHGMVRNGHEEAKGSHYEVWAVADVTRTFRRFVDACRQETDHFASHPDIDRRFHIKPGLLKQRALTA